jgi:hypothetical protein
MLFDRTVGAVAAGPDFDLAGGDIGQVQGTFVSFLFSRVLVAFADFISQLPSILHV